MHAQRKLVSFIGLGSQSAAPLLYSYLRMHPNTYIHQTDTEFFSNTKVYSQGIIWYESQFSKSPVGSLCGELSYNYLNSVQSVSLITKTYPDAKLVAVVENPLLSVRTAYVEARYARVISPKVSLAMFIKQNPEVLMRAKYGRQLAEYFSFYSPNDLLVVLAEDIKNDTLATLARVYDHIGADKSFIPTVLKHLIPPDEEELKFRPGIIKRTYRGIKKLIKASFHFVAIRIHPAQISVEAASVVAAQLPMSAELEKYLKDYYRQDIEMLSHLLHRSLSVEWGIEGGSEEDSNKQ
jgi:hypothetical protein